MLPICVSSIRGKNQLLYPLGKCLQKIINPSFEISTNSEVKLSEWDRARPFEDIPTMSMFSFLKNFLPGGIFYQKSLNDCISNLRKLKGDVFYFSGKLGMPSVLLCHNPEDFEKVFRTEGQWPIRKGLEVIAYHRSEYRKDMFQGIEGVIFTQNEQWGSFRSAVNPVLMQPRNIKAYWPKMSKVNQEFVDRIKKIRNPQNFEVPANFHGEINRFTLESISIIALDKQMGLIRENRENPDAIKLFDNLIILLRVSGLMELSPPLWKLIATSKYKQVMNALDNINEVTNKYVNEAVARLENANNLSLERPESEMSILEKLLKIDKKIATVMAMDMLMAGVDTTSSAIAGILLCLAQNPEKQNKLRKEIRNALPHKDVEMTAATMDNVPYLRACIKESFRMYPINFANGRNSGQDIVLSGYRVPKGTQVVMMTICLLKDPQHFPEPNEFIPERWLRQPKGKTATCPYSLQKINPFIDLPFGFGPRSCIGRRIVQIELEGVIARIVRNFNIEFKYPTENAFKNTIINVPAIPLKFKFTDLPD